MTTCRDTCRNIAPHVVTLRTYLVIYYSATRLEGGLHRVTAHLGHASLVVRPLDELDHRAAKNILVRKRQGGAEPHHLHPGQLLCVCSCHAGRRTDITKHQAKCRRMIQTGMQTYAHTNAPTNTRGRQPGVYTNKKDTTLPPPPRSKIKTDQWGGGFICCLP